MKTRIIPIDAPEALPVALQLLRAGKLVAFPTDTVYGLGALVFHAAAVENIYAVKNRSAEKSIPVLLAGVEDLEKVAVEVPEMALTLAAKFWPGALTLVIPKHPGLPSVISAGPTVGVRVPGNTFARELLHLAGPMAVTSANRSDMANPVDPKQVLEQLNGRIPLVLDGGRTPGSLPSTVVDCTGMEPKILRPGAISLEEIQNALQQV
jgi:L-threonylcarbamoyladenylate synthase